MHNKPQIYNQQGSTYIYEYMYVNKLFPAINIKTQSMYGCHHSLVGTLCSQNAHYTHSLV